MEPLGPRVTQHVVPRVLVPLECWLWLVERKPQTQKHLLSRKRTCARPGDRDDQDRDPRGRDKVGKPRPLPTIEMRAFP